MNIYPSSAKVAITTTSFAEYDRHPLAIVEGKGFKVVLNPYGRKMNAEEVLDICSGAVGVIAGTETLNADIFRRLPDLKVISRCGTGLDNVDLETAKKLGIKVFSTPDAPTLAVAELTVGLLLSLLRKVNQMDISIKNGKWGRLMGNLLCGKKVGIIGFGRIGRKVAELLKPFRCGIRYYDIRDTGLRIEGISDKDKLPLNPLDELLKTSDIVLIHVSTKEQIIGENEIRQMKKGAWLVNVSRGGVVDEDALYNALRSGSLSGAALDVFEKEPYTGRLRYLDNVILTPHVGSYAMESRIEMELHAARHLLKGLGVAI